MKDAAIYDVWASSSAENVTGPPSTASMYSSGPVANETSAAAAIRAFLSPILSSSLNPSSDVRGRCALSASIVFWVFLLKVSGKNI